MASFLNNKWDSLTSYESRPQLKLELWLLFIHQSAMFSYMQYLYMRDDDVRKINKNFILIFNFFKKHKIPVVYGLIPKSIEKNSLFLSHT